MFDLVKGILNGLVDRINLLSWCFSAYISKNLNYYIRSALFFGNLFYQCQQEYGLG